jgi:hypothetical protein
MQEMSRRRKIVVAVIAATVLGIAAVGCAEAPSEKSAEAAEAQPQEEPTETPAPASVKKQLRKEQKAKPEAPMTVAQANALRSAESYIDLSGFSREGLIGQLKYQGFSKKDAVYAADAVGANWKKEAVESAQSYLDLSGFSRSGLIEQLEYEGFTPAQAAYATDKVGL